MFETINYVIVFAVGACVGSFLNVCIYRIPAGLSVVRPGSRCPACGAPVRGYDNIPVLSYFILGGKCRSCKASFSIRYAMVELLVALLGVALYLKFAFAPEFFVYAAFTAALVTVAFIDLDHKIIPNVISLPGIVAGVAVACFFAFVPEWGGFDLLYPSVVDSLIGLALGGGFLFLISFGYYMLTGRDGLGFGDVKLLAMIGAFVGWKGVLFTIFTGSVVGAFVGVFIMFFRGKSAKYAVPFGPFLSLGALLYIFFGREIISWYLSLLMVGPY